MLSGGEGGRARAGADLEYRDDLQRGGVDHRDLIVALGGDIHEPAILANGDGFRLTPHLQLGHDLPARDIRDAHERGILVGHEDPRAVWVQRDLLGVGAGSEHPHDALFRQIDYADAIGGSVGRWQAVLVDAGRRWG